MKKIYFLLLVLASGACSDNDEPKPQRTLIDAKSVLKRTASELITFVSASGINLPANTLIHDVEIFEVTYETEFKGEMIVASGLVILPLTNESVPIVSFQHGTITADSEAPTNLPLNSTTLILYAALASPGLIAVIPDFIGFGESSEYFHPYYVEEYSASAVLDNIRAARDLSDDRDISFNENLFLAGYSQGGYTTLAAHKSIEENGFPGFNLIASFPAAGGYDVKSFQEYFFSLETYANPYYLGYVALSYKSTYDWTNSLSEFFNDPYASNLPSLYNGINTSAQINAGLTNNIAALVQEDVRLNIDTDANYSYLKNAFEENSLLDWSPTKPIFFYHGDADTTVPFQNSVSVYDHFISRGVSSQTIKLITLPGKDHSTGVVPYIEDFTARLLSMK